MNAAKTARPRAPSGGSATLPPAQSRQAAPSVDLLGLGDFSAPISSPPAAQSGGFFTAAPTSSGNDVSWGDFSGPSQVQQAPAGTGFQGFNMFDTPAASQQPQSQGQGPQGPQTLNMMSGQGSQTRRTVVPAKPVLSESDVRRGLLLFPFSNAPSSQKIPGRRVPISLASIHCLLVSRAGPQLQVLSLDLLGRRSHLAQVSQQDNNMLISAWVNQTNQGWGKCK